MVVIKGWRQRWRRRFFHLRLPSLVGENPLEVAMVAWGLYTAVNLVVGNAPSNSLQALPDGLETFWTIMMFTGGVSISLSLWNRRDTAIAACMYLFATTQAAFAVAILGAAGWSKGGSVAGFLIIIGSVCFLRGWWLKTDEAVENRQIVRSRRREDR